MKKRSQVYGVLSVSCVLLFTALLVCLMTVDIAPIAPNGETVGLSHLNDSFRTWFGFDNAWYLLSEWPIFASIAVAAVFGVIGLMQWMRRKRLSAVDTDLYVLGGCYAVMALIYVAFEVFVVNVRPVLLDGVAEASFPSSHVLIVVCVLGTAIEQCCRRIPSKSLRVAAVVGCALVIALTVIGRMLSGVHWLTDLFGGLLISHACVFAYLSIVARLSERTMKEETLDSV